MHFEFIRGELGGLTSQQIKWINQSVVQTLSLNNLLGVVDASGHYVRDDLSSEQKGWIANSGGQ
jgi:hypothetical protein